MVLPLLERPRVWKYKNIARRLSFFNKEVLSRHTTARVRTSPETTGVGLHEAEIRSQSFL
jgi:hypothetical protein